MITTDKIKKYFSEPKNKPLTPVEMRNMFGCIPVGQLKEVGKIIVICKDGLIRRR